MRHATTTDTISTEQHSLLAEFARACRSAARSVSLYPPTHPSIRATLARVAASAARLTAAGDVTLTIYPDTLGLDGVGLARADTAVSELAALFHERMAGAIRIERHTQAEDWHALLLQLARPPEDVIAAGGLARTWAETGRPRFEIRGIDYAEVLRERSGGVPPAWDRIIACCLQGESIPADERTLVALAEALRDPERFGDLLDRAQQAWEGGGRSITARTGMLLRLLKAALDAATARGQRYEDAIDALGRAVARLTPDMMLGLLGSRESPDADEAALASAVANRMSDTAIAWFVAASVATEHGATERLAQAFEALVPDPDHKARLLDLAREEARQAEFGSDGRFDEVWQRAAEMLLSYSDANYVSEAYARELSGVRTQALDVERTSDDPPERIQAWLASVSDEAVRQLDLHLLLDLLRIERRPEAWTAVTRIAAAELERRVVAGDFDAAHQLWCGLAPPEGLPEALSATCTSVLDTLASGPLVRHLVLHLRKADDTEVEPLARFVRTMGPRLVRPLAEALAAEDNPRAIRRLRELLLGFGPAGRESVEQLKHSSNPAVRRTAIDLLRVFGGREALPELASMLGDADPQVQRESIRAIVQIGTPEALDVLEGALSRGEPARSAILQQLLGLRDPKTIPMLCRVLARTRPRGAFARMHADIIDALGGLGGGGGSVAALKNVLYAGDWWAPFRTAALRKAAASALRRIGSSDALEVLAQAAANGPRGVRAAARAHVPPAPAPLATQRQAGERA